MTGRRSFVLRCDQQSGDRRGSLNRATAGGENGLDRALTNVWGTCTFHEYTARCPNRADTVRAHNWVVLGALLPRPGQPAWFLPVAGRLYFRKTNCPRPGSVSAPSANCWWSCAQAAAAALSGPHLRVFDGGFALRSVVRPLAAVPSPGSRGSSS